MSGDGTEDRLLSANERVELRHMLQVLSEIARTVRSAMDPQHGMPNVPVSAWHRQWASMTSDLNTFTGRLRPGPDRQGGE
jgi:hypothetical protein